jgi:branched-subunit amino acid transport protein
MTLAPDTLALILGMALVTYAPRALPLLLLSSRDLNPSMERWLSLIPPAVLAALLAPELLLDKNAEGARLFVAPENIMLLAALPAFLVAWSTRSFMGTVLTGIAAVACGRWLFA